MILLIVERMEMCDRLEGLVRRNRCRELRSLRLGEGLPGDVVTVGDAVLAIRRVGRRSDVVLEALIESSDSELVPMIIVEALLPMMKTRCAGDRARLDEVVGELLFVLDDVRSGRCRATQARLANFLMDSAWDRGRRERRRERWSIPTDTVQMVEVTRSVEAGPERLAVNRVALVNFRDQVRRQAGSDRVLLRSWNDAIRLSERARSNPADQDRWKYVRKVLRRYADPELVA